MSDQTNAIVALPAMMLETVPTGERAPLPVAPEVAGPEFDPMAHLEASQVEAIRQYVVKTARSPQFGHEVLMQLIEQFNAGGVPAINEMLENLRMQRHDELADVLQDTTKRMRQVSREIPVVDPDWLAKVEAGQVLFRKITGVVQDISDKIREAIDKWSSFLDEFEEADRELARHQDQMQESRLRNDAVAEQEFERSVRLIQLCATLSLFREEIHKRLGELNQALESGPNDAMTEEKRRLENLSPIMVNTLGSLIPLIPTTSNNSIMFTNQRNLNALQEFRLFLFRTFGIAQWKANTLLQLNALSTKAASLALSIAEKAMNEEGRKASEAYVQEMTQTAEDLRDFMLELDTFQVQVAAIEEGSKILSEGLVEADKKAREVSRQIEAGRGRVEAASDKWSATLQDVLEPKADA